MYQGDATAFSKGVRLIQVSLWLKFSQYSTLLGSHFTCFSYSYDVPVLKSNRNGLALNWCWFLWTHRIDNLPVVLKFYFRFGRMKHLYELKELFHMGKSYNSERKLCPTDNITFFILSRWNLSVNKQIKKSTLCKSQLYSKWSSKTREGLAVCQAQNLLSQFFCNLLIWTIADLPTEVALLWLNKWLD